MSKKTTEQFILEAKNIYKNKYNYDNSIYTGKYGHLIIKCNLHNYSFTQQARTHLQGQEGCKMCLLEKQKTFHKLTTEEFINKSKLIHGDKYNYNNTFYNSNVEKVEIICNYHGSFFQVANTHLRGGGCPKCNNYSNYLKTACKNINTDFLNDITGYFYVIKLSNKEEFFYKVGITMDIEKRFKEFKKHFTVELLYLQKETLHNTLKLENMFLNDFKMFKYKPIKHFSGYTECLTINPIDYYNFYYKK